MVTGAAAGIIGVLSGQGLMAVLKKKNEPWHVGVSLTEDEVREIVVKDTDYIGRKGVMQLMTELSEGTQKALDQLNFGQQQLMERERLNNIENQQQAARIAQVRAQVAAAPAPAQQNLGMEQIQALGIEEMQARIDLLTNQNNQIQRQVFGG